MEYFIAPTNKEIHFPKISSPEEIKFCDPGCGSGHMLTYAFDLLYEIYQEAGYSATEIAPKILAHNLFGMEIDDRAGSLSAFALTMKAVAYDRTLLKSNVPPNICVFKNVSFKSNELDEYINKVGPDLFTFDLRQTLVQFAEAKNFGSLIIPCIGDCEEVAKVLATKELGGNLFMRDVHTRVKDILHMTAFLGREYHVVVANPPYMGAKGMSGRLKHWVNEAYEIAKSDLMTCFMERCSSLTKSKGFWAMINLPSWMFLGSYDRLRDELLRTQTIVNMLHLGRGMFGPDFGTVAFVIQKITPAASQTGIYRRLFEKQVSVRRPEEIERLFRIPAYNLFVARQANLKKVPGSPIAYWLSASFISCFEDNKAFADYFDAKQGLATGNNSAFLRFWFEVCRNRIDLDQRNYEEFKSNAKWFPGS
jgi:N-6 DNA Methylase